MSESLVNKEAMPVEAAEDFGTRWMTGAIFLMVADASFVVALSFGYLYLWAVDTEHAFHPVKSGTASLWWPWAITAVMFLSLGAYRYGMGEHRPVRFGFIPGGVAAVVLMGVALVLNLVQMATFPFSVADNAYASAVTVLAGANVFHLLITLFLGIGIVNRVRRRLTHGRRDWHLRIVGVWWAWVCAASLIAAVTVSVANGTMR
jgi:heme/copper-type cytochrome/quinol oxidase subunit 3